MFQSFASSSRGNAYIVSDGITHILLECGLTHKKLRKAIGFRLSEIAACLISHEHKDHSKCVKDVIRDGIPVYMSGGTADALDLEDVEVVADRQQFSVGTLDILPFATFHNTKEPLGFLIKSRLDGESIAFAIDTVNLGYRFKDLTYLAIEANYDREILDRCESMPENTRYRITCSHMEINTLCRYLKTLDLSRCKEIFLLHLSDANSHEGHFINKAARCVPKGVKITVCRKEE